MQEVRLDANKIRILRRTIAAVTGIDVIEHPGDVRPCQCPSDEAILVSKSGHRGMSTQYSIRCLPDPLAK
jgi:hypothetical protein